MMPPALPLTLALSLAAAQAKPREPGSAPILRYLSDVWQTEQGLPQNGIQAIAQTREGYLWLGTPGGLVRFDGVRFAVFNQGQFQNNNVHALLADRHGRLWIGTYGGGLYQYENGRFRSFGADAGLESAFVRTLYEARDGTVWIGTHGGGVTFWKDGRFHTLRAKDGLTNDIVRVIHEDRAGRVWIGTNASGLNRWTGQALVGYAVKSGRLERYRSADALSNDNVLALLDDRHDGLWVGTDGAGLWKLQGDRIVREPAEINGVRHLLEDTAGDLWIGTDGGGLHRLREGRLEALTSRRGLPSDIVLTLLEDRERNLWVGTRDGLLRLKNRKFLVYSTEDGLSNDFIAALHHSRDGSVWVGTRVGLDRLAHERASRAVSPTPLPRDIVASLLEDRSGILWVGMRDGLFRIKHGRMRRFSTADGLQGNYVTAIADASDGGIWVGTHGGLDHLKHGRVRRIAAPEGIVVNVTAIHEAADGLVWVGTENAGLGSLTGGRWHFFATHEGLAHASVTAIADDGESLWITTRQGLSRFRNGRLRHYSKENGLPSNQLFSVVDDGLGSVWVTSYAGIFRVEKHSADEIDVGRRHRLTLAVYDKSDGLRSSECNSDVQPAVGRGVDGRLWFATVNGLAVIDPAHIPSNQQPPPVLVEQVRVDDTPFAPREVTRLPPGVARVDFQYTALSFSSPAKVRFRYKLEGFDADWIEAGARRVGYYTNIPPGQYRFRVMASNEDGLWNEAAPAVAFVVDARFYQTAMFWIAAAAVLGAATFAAYRLHVRRLTAQFAAVLAERSRIARDIHDTLAQSLVGLAVQLDTVAKMQSTSPTEAQRRLDRARVLVRSSLVEARRSVWNLRSQALEQADLAGALREVAEQSSGDRGVAVRISGTPRRLPVDVEQHLLRIAQEAVANAVRHADARSIDIDLLYGNGLVRLSVRDDGRGFDVESVARRGGGHFGVAGIRERVHHLGGELSLNSRIGDGAEVVVEVPV
jgi:ligand-binding sensor domain-containing protein/signal transduction histidine kinase